MEMTLNYSGAFCELKQNELEFVNGGHQNVEVALLVITGAAVLGAIVGLVGLAIAVI